MAHAQIDIWDSRSGTTAPAFVTGDWSSHAGPGGLIVVDTTAVDWVRYATLLDEVLLASHAQPFVLCKPWVPGADRTLQLLAVAFPHTPMDGHGRLRTRPAGPFMADAFALRQQAGGDGSGTWILGTCASIDALSEAVNRAWTTTHGIPAFVAGASLAHLVGALCLDEMTMSTLVARLTSENEAVVEDLVRDLSGLRTERSR